MTRSTECKCGNPGDGNTHHDSEGCVSLLHPGIGETPRCSCGMPSTDATHRPPPDFCYVTVMRGTVPGSDLVNIVVDLPSAREPVLNFPAVVTNLLDSTTAFMRLGGQLEQHGFPDDFGDELRELRRKLLSEEIREYFDGEYADDLVEVVDGLLDVVVVAWGTLLAYLGVDRAQRAAAEVARSNLSKVNGSLGPIVRREDGKLLKPAGWTPPDIEGAIK